MNPLKKLFLTSALIVASYSSLQAQTSINDFVSDTTEAFNDLKELIVEESVFESSQGEYFLEFNYEDSHYKYRLIGDDYISLVISNEEGKFEFNDFNGNGLKESEGDNAFIYILGSKRTPYKDLDFLNEIYFSYVKNARSDYMKSRDF